MECIAMCYGDVPVRRFVTGRTARLTYITSSRKSANRFSGVGFPNGAVFEFDERVFEALCRAHEK